MQSLADRDWVAGQFSGNDRSHVGSNQEDERERGQGLEHVDHGQRKHVDTGRLEEPVGENDHAREDDDRRGGSEQANGPGQRIKDGPIGGSRLDVPAFETSTPVDIFSCLDRRCHVTRNCVVNDRNTSDRCVGVVSYSALTNCEMLSPTAIRIAGGPSSEAKDLNARLRLGRSSSVPRKSSVGSSVTTYTLISLPFSE